MSELKEGICYFTKDFDENMMAFVREKWGRTYSMGFNKYDESLVISLRGKPYTSCIAVNYDKSTSKQLNKQQFQEITGMINKQFTKDDLKTGHLVVLRNGIEFVVFKDSVSIYQDNCSNTSDVLVQVLGKGWMNLNEYFMDMVSNSNKGWDIMEVYLQAHQFSFVREYEPKSRKLLWKREEKSEKDLQVEELQATIAQAQEQINKLKEMK